jgi:hypothetical protein
MQVDPRSYFTVFAGDVYMKGAALFETEVQKPRDDLNQILHIRCASRERDANVGMVTEKQPALA